ncbi:MAG: hypothetical protein MI725_05175 [Pirellulales bacterium]|nr:hypothetical protein [Pirellulales bacterium]
MASDDQELLALCRIKTKDGLVQEGIELTTDRFKSIADKGLNPTWYLLPEFVEKVVQRKSNVSPAQAESTESKSTNTPDRETNSIEQSTQPATGTDRPSLPADPVVRATVLEHLHFNDQEHARETKEIMGRILQLVETNQELQKQSNLLFKQFQEAFKSDGQMRVVSTSAPVAAARTVQSQPADDQPRAIDAEVYEPVKSSKTGKKASTKKSRSGPEKAKATKKKPAKKKLEPISATPIWKRDVRDLLRLR